MNVQKVQITQVLYSGSILRQLYFTSVFKFSATVYLKLNYIIVLLTLIHVHVNFSY